LLAGLCFLPGAEEEEEDSSRERERKKMLALKLSRGDWRARELAGD